MVEGFGVTDHTHLHLIPLFESGDMNASLAHTESEEDMTMMAQKIQSYLL